MSRMVRQPVALGCIFIWIGMVCAISFLEAWLKFRAPGVTLPIGLGIGRLVFSALNKVEWILALIAVTGTFLHRYSLLSTRNVLLLIAVIILVVQTFWLLPALDTRAQWIIDGRTPPPSNLHIVFIAAEITKVSSLFATAVHYFDTV